MKKRKHASGKIKKVHQGEGSLKSLLSLYSRLADLKQQLDNLGDSNTKNSDRLTDLEVHLNLLTRLLTTLCVEKFGMKVGVLKRLVRRIEKEAVRDSQIMELESLYRSSQEPQKKNVLPPNKSKEDPWDQIS